MNVFAGLVTYPTRTAAVWAMVREHGWVLYEYDGAAWSRGEAWRHLWESYLASAQHVSGVNPFRKCHAAGVFRWEGPALAPRP